MEVGKNNR